MADTDFPRAVYKKAEGGNSQPLWGLGSFEVRHVDDQDALDAAGKDGWSLSPADAADVAAKAAASAKK